MHIFYPALKDVLEYFPNEGKFLWKVALGPNGIVGKEAGSIYTNGYRYIQIDNIDYRAARLAWWFITGEEPGDLVDHINGIKSDDRFVNLRLATDSQNQANRGKPSNNTSGFKGVTWQPLRRKYMAKIEVNGKAKNLGRYTHLADAVMAYRNAAIAAWGEFAKFPSLEEIEALR